MGIQERREREKEELRRNIILTASRLISKIGHENLTIRKLAAAIEYSPRTIYLYFRDKEELLQEIIEEGFRRTLEIRRAKPESGISMEERLRSHIASAFEDPHFYRAVVTLLLEKRYEPGPAQQAVMKELQASITGEEGERRRGLAMIISSSLRGFTLSLLNIREQLSTQQIESLIDQYITFTMNGVRT
jgi:AcrR family transcriptional regulator